MRDVSMSKVSKILLSLVLLYGFPSEGSTEHKKQATSKADVVISRGKPTVYITFERAGDRMPSHTEESNKGLWLSLHNNTRWTISFCTESSYIGRKTTGQRLNDGRVVLGLREGTEVSACYEVEAVRAYESGRNPQGGLFTEQPVTTQQPPIGTRGHLLATSWLPPGRSVIFSIPREHLAKHLAIYVLFNYEWETGERDLGNGEPQHRVYFRASDLPENIPSK